MHPVEAPTIVDLFAGAGGIYEGFRLEGFRAVAASDIDPDACATYKLNFPGANVIHGDVRYEAVAREILEGLRLQAPSREVATRVQDGLVAPGDPRMLRTVLHNLLGNAWKFTGPSEAATIEVGRRREGARQVFYVKDKALMGGLKVGDKIKFKVVQDGVMFMVTELKVAP